MTAWNVEDWKKPKSDDDEQKIWSVLCTLSGILNRDALPPARHSGVAISHGSLAQINPSIIPDVVLAQFPRPRRSKTQFSTTRFFGAKFAFDRSGAMQSREISQIQNMFSFRRYC